MENLKKIITKIEVQKKNKDRVNVYINDEFAFACSAELVYMHNIVKGKNVDAVYLHEIIEEDNYIKCKSTGLKIIERTYKTEFQITSKLVEKGYDEKAITRTIKFLKQYGFVNDEKFTEMYIKDKIKGCGKNKIKYDLIRKGIDEEKINVNLASLDSTVEKQSAFKLAEKKYNLIVKNEQDYKKIYKKVSEHLMRKGYSSDIVSETLRNVVNKEIHELNQKDVEFKTEKNDLDKIYKLAEKRYSIIIKSEDNYNKIYKKLSDYLLRRGYSWENIKSTLKSIVDIDKR